MRDDDQRPQLSIEDLEPPPDCDTCAGADDGEPEPRGVAVIWPPASDD